MSPTMSTGAQSAPSLSLDSLQRRHIAARVNVSAAVAGVLALHAYGQPRDTVMMVANVGTLTGEARR